MLVFFVTAVLAVILVSLILYARWHYGELEAAGIPVVPPHFICGSDPNYHNIVLHEVDTERMKKYGPVWGVYEGRAPHVFIADADMARAILIKDFDHFRDRRELDFGHDLINETLDILPYNKWRPLRKEFSPAFTTGKIRLMSDQIEEAVKTCISFIDQEIGSRNELPFDTKQVFVNMTTDVIARTVFGTELNNVNDPANEFVTGASTLSGDVIDPPFYFSLLFTFPFLARFFPQIFPTNAMNFFGKQLSNILTIRKNIKKNDIVDVLNELVKKLETPEYKKLGITMNTIYSQAILLLIAGFETTAITLSMLSYNLALNPDKQQKLVQELDDLLEKDGKLTHDSLGELPYMNACIQETLRTRSPLVRIERVCEKDWTHEETGTVIKKGWVAILPIHAFHLNEKYWPEPEKFIPERFLPENKEQMNPYAFVAFGHGPRNCIGMRFAKEVIQLSMALILKDFTFEPVPEASVEYKKGRWFLAQYHPVPVKIVRRQK